METLKKITTADEFFNFKNNEKYDDVNISCETINRAEEWIDKSNVIFLRALMLSNRWIRGYSNISIRNVKSYAKSDLYEDYSYVVPVIFDVMGTDIEIEVILETI